MDNFCVPKKINRHVVKALSFLQTTPSHSVFFPMESIVNQVELQMRRTKPIVNIEDYVYKSLCSLTRLGIVARVGPSDYALRQALQFSAGVSAIPWKTVPQVHNTVSRRILIEEYRIIFYMFTQRSNRKIKLKSDQSVSRTKTSQHKLPVKPKKRKPTVKVGHSNRKPLCSTCRSALKTFINAYTGLKIGHG